MGTLGASDIVAMLADLEEMGGTVDVVFGGTTVQGLLDHQAVELLGEPMPGTIAHEMGVHIESGSLPGLTSGSAITVDGASYVVRNASCYGDGAMTRVALRTP